MLLFKPFLSLFSAHQCSNRKLYISAVLLHALMSNKATFTKRVSASRNNHVIWIPKDVAVLMNIKQGDIVQVLIKKLKGDFKS